MANELPLPLGGGFPSGPPPKGSGNSSCAQLKRHCAEIHPSLNRNTIDIEIPAIGPQMSQLLQAPNCSWPASTGKQPDRHDF
jgi:hypothetical protein